MTESIKAIAPRVLDWFDAHGRKDLPWQQDKTYYRVWVSEIMLQQTQVSSVIDYFKRFMTRFPTLQSLAEAPLDDVLGQWAGLGYYARARNLHATAQRVIAQHDGVFPREPELLETLPGIGRSTAAAIVALVDDRRAAILDGNVKRVLARHEAIEGWPGKTTVVRALWLAAERYTPEQRVSDYTQAMMDLGATLCTRSAPDCPRCPLRDSCAALASGRVDALPGRRPRKANPQRETRFLVMRRRDGALWLTRRPERGIWGGLYSFPEFSEQAPLPAGWRELARRELAPIKHKFTHFDLTVSPLLVEVDAVDALGDGDQARWLLPDELAVVGVPRPVERLIQSLQSTPIQAG